MITEFLILIQPGIRVFFCCRYLGIVKIWLHILCVLYLDFMNDFTQYTISSSICTFKLYTDNKFI
jgi:hypothetical protein